MPVRPITDQEIATYERDGVVCLRGLFDDAWVETMREAAEFSLTHPSEMAIEMAESRGHSGRYFFDTFIWRTNPQCRSFVFDSPAAQIVAELTKSARVNLFFDQWLIKEPGTETPTPWHHDLPYWPIEGDQIATLWLALDRVDLASGAVEYVTGSHRWGQRFFPETFSGMDGFTDDKPKVPDIDANRDAYDIVHFDLEPGDCTVHHSLLVHGAAGNHHAEHRRRGYVTRWAGSDARFDAHADAVHMPPLPPLAHGDRLDSELWPVVYSA